MTTRICPECQTPLPDSDADWLCPKCLLRQASAAPGELAPTDPHPGSKLDHPASSFQPPASSIEYPVSSSLQHPELHASLPVLLVLGDYELLEEIGRGGMGVIYRARQRKLNRIVAVKILLSGAFSSKESVQRFRAEAAAAARLQHPNIVAIHDVGEQDGHFYFSMDCVEGRNLAQTISDFGFRISDFRRTARWMKTIAAAIHYAHQRGIIHRDLKPSNVLIDAQGEVRITDFDLAKRLEPDAGCSMLDTGYRMLDAGSAPARSSSSIQNQASSIQTRASSTADLTLTGQVLGSPNYLPPEQAGGKSGDVGVHSDVYALGAILYHMLTGQPPFAGETLQVTLNQVLNHEPTPPRLLNPRVPIDLETICLKCLEKEPARRYPSAEALAEELDRYLQDEPIRARPVSTREKVWRWCRRNPVVASLAAATTLLLVGFAVGSPIAAWRINRERLRAEQNAEESRQRLVRLNVTHGKLLAEAGDVLSALPWFVEALQREKGNLEIHRMRIELILQQSPRLIQCWVNDAHTGAANASAQDHAKFSPDGRRVAMIGSQRNVSGHLQGVVHVRDVATGELVFPPLQHSGPVSCVEFSPDGRLLVTGSGSLNQPTPTPLPGGELSNLRIGRNSPPGRGQGVGSVVVSGSEGNTEPSMKVEVRMSGEARIWDALTGEPRSPALQHEGMVNHIAFSPNGRYFVASTQSTRPQAPTLEGEAIVWDAWAAVPTVPPLQHPYEVRWARFSPDGRRIVTAGLKSAPTGLPEGFVQLWDAATGQPLISPRQFHGLMQAVRFDSERIHVLSSSVQGPSEARIVDLITGHPIGQPMPHEQNVITAAFSADGASIVTGGWDKTVRLWDAATGSLRGAVPRVTQIFHASFSPDSRQFVTAGHDGTARLWGAQSAVPLSPPLPHNAHLVQATFSPDGRRILVRDANQVVRVWDLPVSDSFIASGGRADLQVRPTTFMAVAAHQSRINQVEFSPGGHRILTASTDGTARVWDAVTGQPVTPPMAHSNAVVRARFSSDGRFIATASDDRTARVWDANLGQPVTPPLLHPERVWSAAFSPDGSRLLTASGHFTDQDQYLRKGTADSKLALAETHRHLVQPGEARIWDVKAGKLLLPPLGHSNSVTCAEFSPDGRRVVTGSLDSTARVWDAYTGQPVTPFLLQESCIYTAIFSPDGHRVVTACSDATFLPGTARLWDAATGQPVLAPIKHRVGVYGAVYSPNGKLLVTWDDSARVWDVQTGHPLTPPLSHPGTEVRHAAFSPDSRLLVTTAHQGTRVWDAFTGEPVSPMLNHPSKGRWCAFSPDGHRIVSASDDGIYRVWNLRPFDFPTEDLVLIARLISGRQVNQTGTDLEALDLATVVSALQVLRSKHLSFFAPSQQD
ncbi:MAG: protein kinase [Verrucomicrobia bacterium]|nr:protein kinase [Verrucomicrobiota bacterium]